MKRMIKGELVDGFDLGEKEIARLEEATCGSCTRAKQHRRSFPSSQSKTTTPMELIHTDVMMMPILSR
jgi:hypothetical protein